MTMMAPPVKDSCRTWALATLVFLCSLTTYSLYGFDGLLYADDGIHIYSAQQVIEGVAPYRSIFDLKGPGTPFIEATALVLGRSFGVDDVTTVRTASWIFSSAAVAGLFLLGRRILGSTSAALLAAAFFVAFWGFGIFAVSGPRAKTWAVGLEIFALLAVARRSWSIAGALGAVCALIWQPMGILPAAILLVVAVRSPSGERGRAFIRTAAPMVVTAACVLAYFAWHRALFDLFDGTIGFTATMLDRGEHPGVLARAAEIVSSLRLGFRIYAGPIIIGLATTIVVSAQRSIGPVRGRRPDVLHDVALWTATGWMIWSFLDYQSFIDFFPLLPWAALGLGGLAWRALRMGQTAVGWSSDVTNRMAWAICATVVIHAAAGYASMNPYGWTITHSGLVGHRTLLEAQRADVARALSIARSPQRIAVIGHPEILAILGTSNFSRFVHFPPHTGLAEHLEARLPAGTDSYLQLLEDADPDVVLYRYTGTGVLGGSVDEYLSERFERRQAMSVHMFVRKGLVGGRADDL